MKYSLRQCALDDKLCQQISVAVLEKIYPRQSMLEILDELGTWEKRERKLNMLVVLLVVLAACLWTRLSYVRVLQRLGQSLLLCGLPLTGQFASKGAISQRRQQLGAEPLKKLFERHAFPMCTQDTPGAFRFGKRVMAIDGTIQDLPDTEANRMTFSAMSNDKGPGPFPQARLVVLVECGSHAIVAAEISGVEQGERTGCYKLLPAITSEMLVMTDSGFTGAIWLHAIRARGAEALAVLPSHHLPRYHRQLSDGSYLASYELRTDEGKREQVVVRVIAYRITDARLGKPEKICRLVTTILDEKLAPAQELIEASHERWEAELVFDEIKTHQRLQQAILRSRQPEGVRQELYALFLVHYAVRSMMYEAACQAKVDPDRVSFTQALEVVQENVLFFALVEANQQESLWSHLLSRLQENLLPPRRLRVHLCSLKRIYRKYKQKKRDVPPLLPFHPKEQFLDFVLLI